MFFWALGFLAGIVWLLQFKTLPPVWLGFILPIPLYVLFILPKLQCSHVYKYVWIFLLALLFGFLWGVLRADIIISKNIKAIEFGTVVIEGKVVSLPETLDRGMRFEFYVNTVEFPSGMVLKELGKVKLRWYAKPELNPAEYWRLHVRLKRPHSLSNKGSFDYEAWLFQQRIQATGYVIDKAENKLLDSGNNTWFKKLTNIDYMRHLLRELIKQLPVNAFEKSFLLGLGLGDRSDISDKQWDVLTKTGTSHLLAISGLHIGLAAGLFFMLSSWLWAFSIVLPKYLARQHFAIFSGLFGAFLYAALAGFTIPTQRALIMLSIWMLALLLHKKIANNAVIAIALFAVLLIDPFAVMAQGFWLSFLAISVIAYAMTCRTHGTHTIWSKIWLKMGKAQYAVSIAFFPVLILCFQQYPLLSALANVIAIPYFSFVVMPFLLFGIVLLIINFSVGSFVLQWVGKSISVFWPLLEYLSQIESQLLHIAPPTTAIFLLAMVGVLIILLPKGFPNRWVGIFWLLPLCMPYRNVPEHGDFWLTQLDVGQGLSSVIQTQNNTLIYDAGDRFNARFDMGKLVLIPFLEQHNISDPNILLVSHADRDHIGGSLAVLARYPEIKVLTSALEEFNHHSVEQCAHGMQWDWDGVSFEILSPILTDDKDIYHGNNSSCVLKVGNAWHSVLLTGDIEKTVENRLVHLIPHKLAAQVLIVPHHGSATSSSDAFIDAVFPEVAVFPTGYQNRFRFPKQGIISRYEARQVIMLNTARDGALLFNFSDQDMVISRYRQTHKRFWMHE